MRPRRYPYSGKRKNPIGQSIDFTIDKDAILQSVFRTSQSKHPISDLKNRQMYGILTGSQLG